MTFNYQGMWSRLNGTIMRLHAEGKDVPEIEELLKMEGPYGPWKTPDGWLSGPSLTRGMLRFIIKRNNGTWVNPNHKKKKSPHEEATQKISGKHKNPGAFHYSESGMTLRDWFAGQALIAHVTFSISVNAPYSEIAHECYCIADAMLEARRPPA